MTHSPHGKNDCKRFSPSNQLTATFPFVIAVISDVSGWIHHLQLRVWTSATGPLQSGVTATPRPLESKTSQFSNFFAFGSDEQIEIWIFCSSLLHSLSDVWSCTCFLVLSDCAWLLWPSTASVASVRLCTECLTETEMLRCHTFCSALWGMSLQKNFTGTRGRKTTWPTLSSPCRGEDLIFLIWVYFHTWVLPRWCCCCLAGNLALLARRWVAQQLYVTSDMTLWPRVSMAAASLWRLRMSAGARPFCAAAAKLCNSPQRTQSKKSQSIKEFVSITP